MVDRISDPHSQHKWITYVGEPNCRLDVNGPVLRYGIAEDRTHVVLLALPVEAELVRVAQRPYHLEPIAQPLKREQRRRFLFLHSRHSDRVFACSLCRIRSLPNPSPGIAEVVLAAFQ